MRAKYKRGKAFVIVRGGGTPGALSELGGG